MFKKKLQFSDRAIRILRLKAKLCDFKIKYLLNMNNIFQLIGLLIIVTVIFKFSMHLSIFFSIK